MAANSFNPVPGGITPASFELFRPSTWPPALWWLLAAALVLRLPGIHCGLPSLFYHHDEPQIVLRALRFGTGDLNPHAFRWPGTWQMDLMFLCYAAMFAVGRTAGVWHGMDDFAAQYFADPSIFYLMGRGVTVLMGLLTIPIVFVLAERVAGRRAAPWAAALLALNWLHADLSRVTMPTVPMLFWITLALYLISDPSPPGARRSLGVGACCGFAAACLYYGGWVLLAWPGVLAAGVRGPLRRKLRAALGPPFWLAAAGMALAFLAACPWALLDTRTFLHDLRFVSASYATWHSPAPITLPLVNAYELPFRVLPALLSWPVLLLAIWGGVRMWRSGSAWARGVLLYAAGLGLMLLSTCQQSSRYAAPLLPAACVLAGAALAALPRRGGLSLALASLALCWCLYDCGRVALDRMCPDTRELAKQWVESHLPVGSRMVVDALHHRNTFTASLDLAPQNVRDRLAHLSERPAPYGSVEAYRLYYEYLLRYPPRRPYDQEWTEDAERVRCLEEYRQLGFQYAMVSSMVYERCRWNRKWVDSPAGRFYGALEREARLLIEFKGDRFLHPGPTIRIYDLKPQGPHGGYSQRSASIDPG